MSQKRHLNTKFYQKKNEKHVGFKNIDTLADIVKGFRSVWLCCMKAALKQHAAENK